MSVFTRKVAVESEPAAVSPLAHRPKIEHFHVREHTNTDPKGFCRKVDTYDVHKYGLYMARESDHPKFHYLESWLLPDNDMRISIFHRQQVFHRDPAYYKGKSYYIDIGTYTRGENEWVSKDLYLDIVVYNGKAELQDVDELLAALTAGYVTEGEAQKAIETATAAIAGLAATGNDLDQWLKSLDLKLGWR